MKCLRKVGGLYSINMLQLGFNTHLFVLEKTHPSEPDAHQMAFINWRLQIFVYKANMSIQRHLKDIQEVSNMMYLRPCMSSWSVICNPPMRSTRVSLNEMNVSGSRESAETQSANHQSVIIWRTTPVSTFGLLPSPFQICLIWNMQSPFMPLQTKPLRLRISHGGLLQSRQG